jgi:hypothetical protein
MNMKKFNTNLIVVLTALVFSSTFILISPSIAQAAAVNGITNIPVTPSTYQYTTFKGVPVYRLEITNSGNASDTLVSLAPTPVGNVDDTLISLHFYNDANGNGIVDQGDTDLHGAIVADANAIHFHSDNTKAVFTLASPLAIPVGVTHILITADGGPAVGNAQTFQLAFALSTDVVMGTVQITPAPGSNMPNSHDLTVSNTAPSLAITNGANDPIAKTATASQTGVVVKQLTFTAQATSDSIVSLAITPAGTENDATQIASTKFYIDSGTTLGAIDGSDILLSTTPTTYTGDNTKTVFTFLSPFLIPGGTAVNILYTYNLGAGVVGGNTLTAQLVATTDAVAGSGITVSSNSSGVSSTITISTSAPTLAQPTVVSASTVKASSATKVIGAFTVTETGGVSDHIDQFTIENKAALTAVAADIASVAIYSDSGTLGVIDGSDAVACAEATTNTTTNFDAGGSVIIFTCSSPIVIGANATKNYLVVVTTSAGATNGRTMAAKVNAHLVTASAFAASDLSTTNAITIDTTAPSTPTSTPVAGTYIGTQSVTLISTGSDSIYYTTDGSIPSCSVGTLYSGAITITASETINVIGCDTAGNATSAPFAYTINILPSGTGPLVNTPTYTPPTIVKSPSITLIINSITPTTISGCIGTTGFSITTGQSCASNVVVTTTTNDSSGTTTATTYNFGTTTLKNGSKGLAVMELQRFLNAKFNLGLALDGKLGKATIALVKQWQKDHGLVADGLIGAKTKATMNIETQTNK